jgi:hypothetical protein
MNRLSSDSSSSDSSSSFWSDSPNEGTMVCLIHTGCQAPSCIYSEAGRHTGMDIYTVSCCHAHAASACCDSTCTTEKRSALMPQRRAMLSISLSTPLMRAVVRSCFAVFSGTSSCSRAFQSSSPLMAPLAKRSRKTSSNSPETCANMTLAALSRTSSQRQVTSCNKDVGPRSSHTSDWHLWAALYDIHARSEAYLGQR